MLTVAASNADQSEEVAEYSSQGPVTQLLTDANTKQTIAKPNLTAVDAVEVLGVGDFPNIFNGSSAAAAHVAAVAAQMVGQTGNSNREQLQWQLTQSAQGHRRRWLILSGSGLLDAKEAFELIVLHKG